MIYTKKLGNRIVKFEKGIWSINIGGKLRKFKKYKDLLSAINLFNANKSIRKGKRILARYR